MRHTLLIFLFIFIFLFLFFINLNDYKKTKENFENNLSTIIDTNKDSIDNIKKKIGYDSNKHK